MSDHSTVDTGWIAIGEEKPRPHRKYLVRRGGFVHTATPCYGMHAPWWVPMAIDGEEYDPVNMLDADEWRPLA